MWATLRQRLGAAQDRVTIAQQMAILIGLLCLAGFSLLAISVAHLIRAQAVDQANADLSRTASLLAERLDQDMSQRFTEIGLLASMVPLRAVWSTSPTAMRSVLDQLRGSLEVYAWIGFARPDGTVVAATGGLLEGVSVAARPWFKEGLKQPYVGDVHEALLLAKLLGNPKSSEPPRFVDIAFPVRGDDGTVIGVLGAHLAFEWADAMRQNLAASNLNGGAQMWMLSYDGTVLLGPEAGTAPLSPQRLQAIKDTKFGSYLDQSGSAARVGYAVSDGEQDYPGFGWIVLAREEETSALLASQDLHRTIITLTMLVMIGCVVGAIIIARRIAGPLVTLTREASEIGKSPGSHSLSHMRGSMEVVGLSEALRALVSRLGVAKEQTEFAARLASLDAERHARDIRELRTLTETDSLTGLLNLRSFLSIAEAALQGARSRCPSAVVTIDIDFFKGVNDTYGLAAGDRVLKDVGATILAYVTQPDRVARFGGEEFIILLLNTTADDVRALAERLRTEIAARIVNVAEFSLQVTASVGAAVAVADDRDINDIIARANGALAEAKNAGRNTMVIAEAPPAASG